LIELPVAHSVGRTVNPSEQAQSAGLFSSQSNRGKRLKLRLTRRWWRIL